MFAPRTLSLTTLKLNGIVALGGLVVNHFEGCLQTPFLREGVHVSRSLIAPIAPGIYVINGRVGTRPLFLSVLQGETRTVLLDTGCAPDPKGVIAPALQQIGLSLRDIDLVINTHPDADHCGGNSTMKAEHPALLLSCGEADRALVEDPHVMWDLRYDAYVAAHGVTYDDAQRRNMLMLLGDAQSVDWTWRGGETLRLGPDWVVEIHSAPGHSRGHLAVFDPRSGTLLSGDAVQGSVYRDVDGAPALCPTYMHVEAYLDTIRRFEALPIKQLVSCHWPLAAGPAVQHFLTESRAFVERTERRVLDAIQARPQGMTLAELITGVGPTLGDWPRDMDGELRYVLSGHLDHLVSQGRLVYDSGVVPRRYTIA